MPRKKLDPMDLFDKDKGVRYLTCTIRSKIRDGVMVESYAVCSRCGARLDSLDGILVVGKLLSSVDKAIHGEESCDA